MANGGRERAESNSSSGSGSVAGGNNKSKRQKHGNGSHNNRQKIRPVTVETVRRIVAQEGRSARNLISWNAPLDMIKQKPDGDKSDVKQQQGQVRRSTVKRRSKSCDTTDKKEIETLKNNEVAQATREKSSSGGSRSSSAGKKQVSIRARYWAYLFENLRRAVDEIYATCETDQSVVECKEVLLVLDNYRHDFQALIDWINLQERLNSADVTNRPTSLAWEVRKSSPGRPRQRMTPRGTQQGGVHFGSSVPPPAASNILPSPHLKRSSEKKSSSANTVTWADKVKGAVQPQSSNEPDIRKKQNPEMTTGISQEVAEKENPSDDEGGWEKVSSKNKQPKINRAQPKSAASHGKNGGNGSPRSKAGEVTEKKPLLETVVRDKNSNLVIVNEKPKTEKDKEVADHLDFFVDSVGEDTSSTSSQLTVSSHSRSPDHTNMVIERSMGSSSSFSTSVFPVDSNPRSKDARNLSMDSLTNIGKREQLHKVLFIGEDNLPEKDISLQTLDDVEAEYFKSDATLVSMDDDDDEASMLASLDESESKTNKALREHDASIAAAEQEEQELMKEIEEEEKKTIDIEPDQEAENQSNVTENEKNSPGNSNDVSDWNTIMARFEAEQEMHEGMTWGDMIDEEELREPGRIVQMHEKLSSPSRKRTPAESKRKMEEKQRSATLRRQKMVQDKTERIHVLTEKVMDVKRIKDDLIDERRELLQELHIEKLQRAEQQRAMKLMKIVQKAQAEETKVNEILFINELQEQNKRHDVLNRILEHDARLLEIQQERSKMQEVKAAKEENVKERRRLLEKERQDRLCEMINRRKEQDSRIEQLKYEKEKEREKLAREKERERKIRLSALNAAHQEAVTELQKKIQMKHDESERRHQEQLEQRKEKALELSLGRFSLSSSGNLPSDAQNVACEGEKVSNRAATSSTAIDLSATEMDELSGGKGDGACVVKTSPRESAVVVSPRGMTAAEEKKAAKERKALMKERMKAMKKRAKKLKTRMTSRGREFQKVLDQRPDSASSNSKNKVYRLVKDINRQLTNQKDSSGPWPANRISALDRALGEINRLLDKQDEAEKAIFRSSGGFEMLEQVFEVPLNSAIFHGQKGEPVPVLPDKTLSNAASTFGLACKSCNDNVLYVLYAGRLTVMVDSLTQQLAKPMPEDNSLQNVKSPTAARKSATNANVTPDNIFDSAAASFLHSLALCIGHLAARPPSLQEDGKLHLSDNKPLLRALNTTVMTSQRPGGADANDVDPKRFMEGFSNRGLDVVSYIVSCGVLDKLSGYLASVRSEIQANSKAASFIKNGLQFLHSVTDFVAFRNRSSSENSENRMRRTSTSSNASSVSSDKKLLDNAVSSSNDSQGWDNDPTQLLPTLYHTEVMGVISVLYGILLPGAPERPILLRNNSISALDDVTCSSPPLKKIPLHVLQIAMSILRVLNAVADLDIHLLQESLGAEGVSLEFRHICAYLLWYCQHGEYDGLLHEVIVCVGHFALCNKKNQDTVHSGAMPTVLQQLCVLPFAYFSNPRLTDILFPTLIACCHDNPTNLNMLEQEASSCLLSGYIKGILERYENEENFNSEKSHIAGETQIMGKGNIALSSSRLYTSSFLRAALRFFQRGAGSAATSGSDVIPNGEVIKSS